MKGLTVGTGFCHFVIVIRLLSVGLDLYISGTCPSPSPSTRETLGPTPAVGFIILETQLAIIVELNMLEFYLDEII